MKYYLVIGYQTIEKWRNPGRIQLFLNDQLLDDFVVDSDKSVENICHNTFIDRKKTLKDFIFDSQKSKNTMFTTPFDYAGSKFVGGNTHIKLLERDLREKGNSLCVLNNQNKWIQIDNVTKFLQGFKNHVRRNERSFKNWLERLPFQTYKSQPAQLKLYQLNARQFDLYQNNKLKLKIIGGWSNHTNGFVNKHNMIALFPLLLFPEKFLQENYIERIWEKSKKFFSGEVQMNSYPFYIMNDQIPQPKGNGTFTISKPPAQWPGPNWANSDHPDRYWLLGQPVGGDCEMTFYIHKKHRIYSLHSTKTVPQGQWQLNLCFLHIYKRLVDFIQTVA